MNEHDLRLLDMIKEVCRQYQSGLSSLQELQSSVEGISSSLEELRGTDLELALRHFLATIEYIYFMCQPEEHRVKADLEIKMLVEIMERQ